MNNGVRIGWADLPLPVRSAVESIAGGSVVEAQSQAGGYSPGADRIVIASGRRAFVKAVSSSLNSPHLHRREARIVNVLPAGLPIPRFLGMYDDGEWVALVFDDCRWSSSMALRRRSRRCPHRTGLNLHPATAGTDSCSASAAG